MLRYVAPLLCVVACANPSQGVAIDRVVPDTADVQMSKPVTIEGTFHVLTSNLDQGDTKAALVTAAVDTMPLGDATWISQDQVSATMPGLPEGIYDVTVSLDGRSATLKDAYIVGNPPGLDGGSGATATHMITVGDVVIGGPHLDFPLLVHLADPRLATTTNSGEVAHPEGFDVFFSLDSAGMTRLPHELEKYDGTNGELVAWVKIPSLESGTTFFLHAGDPLVTMRQEDPAAVFSSYAAVWHLERDAKDSTGNVNTGTETNTAANPGGQIEAARSFDGSTSLITVASSASINDLFANGGTIEVWLFPTSAGESGLGRILDRGPSLMVMSMCDGNPGHDNSLLFGRAWGGGGSNWCTPVGSVPFNTWTHAAVVYSDAAPGNLPTMYINGVARTITTPPFSPTPTGSRIADNATLALGDRTSGARAFAGSLEEIRLAKAPHDAGWIGTAHRNQLDPISFVTLGP